MRRSRGLRVGLVVTVIAGAVVALPSAADAGTTSGTVTATCTTPPIPHFPPPIPITADYAFTITAPDRVDPGATFAVDFSLAFAVSTVADAGGATILAAANASPASAPIAAGPGAAEIAGSVTFQATGAPGSLIELHLGLFGQFVQLGGFLISQTCVPSAATDLLARVQIGAPLCFGRPATIVSPAGATHVVGTPGDDVIVDANNAVIEGGGGNDLVCELGGRGTLSFTASPSRVFASVRDGVAFSRTGGILFSGIPRLVGSPRNDILVGDGNANELSGWSGNDVLFGLGGADLLDGGPGFDVLVGGPGATCVSGIAIGC